LFISDIITPISGEKMSDIILDFVKKEFEERQQRNTQYSLRAYAKSIGIDHSILSKILSKKRSLTFETADRILSALDIQMSIKNSLLLTISDPSNFHGIGRHDEYRTISKEEMKKSLGWEAKAVLMAFEIPSVNPDTQSIAKFLNLSNDQVQGHIDTFIKMDLLLVSEGIYKFNGQSLVTKGSLSNQDILTTQRSLIEAALKYLDHQELPSVYSSSTIAIPVSVMPEAKRRLDEFRWAFGSWIDNVEKEKTDVYQMNVQFFPLGK